MRMDKARLIPTMRQLVEINNLINSHTHPAGKLYCPYLVKGGNGGTEKQKCILAHE
jgi:hypothetical protein